MEKIIEERRRLRRRAINEAKEFAECVARRLHVVRAVLFGSYARGDFNAWSDIDVLIVVDNPLPIRPPDRLNLVTDCLKAHPLVEPLLITKEEWEKLLAKKNPIAIDAVKHGINLIDNP